MTTWQEDVRPLLARATTIPALRPLYAGVDISKPVPLAEVPVLTKEDFGTAHTDVLTGARQQHEGTIVLGSGGTTSRPKLSVLPSRMFLPDMQAAWSPLDTTDVLLNCNNGGELGSMNPFYMRLAHTCGAAVIPLGNVAPEHLRPWLEFIDECACTAIGGTPTYVASVLECYETAGRAPPFRKIIWTGERYGADARRTTQRVLPEAERYGVYGSTETWVIGHNGPSCDWDVFHPMPYQHVELVDAGILVTTTHPETVNPILRYQVGDRGEWARCCCGREEPGLRVLGRTDYQVKFRSVLFTPEEIAHVAVADPEVRDVQVALFDHGTARERIEVRLRAAEGADTAMLEERVTNLLVDKLYRIAYEIDDMPDRFVARVVPRFFVNDRTNKTPLLVREEA